MAQPIFDPDKIPPAIWREMNISREKFLEIMARMAEREQAAPAIWSSAPDFELERLSAHGQRTGQRERLSSYRGRPVGLVFGSYT